MSILGEKKVIIYRGKPLRVQELKGVAGIYFDIRQRRLFQLYWEEKAESAKTPRQRLKKQWQRKERKFRLFREGVVSCQRGLHAAQLKACLKGVPSWEQALKFFEEEIRETIIVKTFFSPTLLSPTIVKGLLRQGFVFERSKKTELKEAATQIYFLIKDREKTVNVGACLARTVAITDRVKERLSGVYAWSHKYSAQEQVLAAIQKGFHETISILDDQLKLWNRHAALAKGETTELQQRLLQDKMVCASKDLEPYAELRPFAGWAWFTINDLTGAGKAIRDGEYEKGRLLLDRIKISLDIKNKQREIDNLLWRFNEDAVFGRKDFNYYFGVIRSLLGAFAGLAEKEKTSGFKRPVCRDVECYLKQAEEHLLGRSLSKAKKALKRAGAFL